MRPVAAAFLFFALSLPVPADPSLGNRFVERSFTVADGRLKTSRLVNRINGRDVAGGGDEFRIDLSVDGKVRDVTSADFSVTGSATQDSGGTRTLTFELEGRQVPLDASVSYSVAAGQPWMRKSIGLRAKDDVIVRAVTVEALEAPGAYEPYQADQFTARGASQWRPPLGQPVYTRESAAWFGVEFPAARNQAVEKGVECRYLTDVKLKSGGTYTTRSSAVGVTDDSAFLRDALFDYIDVTRARPLRLQTQYNSWFDYGPGVDAKKFAASVHKVNEELVTKRGVPPLKAYVIDDGWQDKAADWTKTGVWPVNGKFDKDFAGSFQVVRDADSHLGLWLSPGCLFGAQAAIPKMKAAGWRSLDPWMSMTGDHYMAALEKRMTALAADGVAYFKLDGVFGHLNTRNFDVEGFEGAENELNDKKHDEAKERYLSLGSDRLIHIFHRMAEVNPDVYIVISNGAFLSPWWLQHVDAVWMINAGDAAGGSDRTSELVYRDARYHILASPERDNTQYPLHSLFNHEPKKTSTGESPDTFRRYLYMNLSRGTGFVELYLKTFKLSESDWDVLAEGMKWVDRVFPNFKRSRMHGGDPQKKEVYGYTGWTETTGYASFHNPSDKAVTYPFQVNRTSGVPKSAAATTFRISSPLDGDAAGLPETIRAGGAFTIELPPKSIRILEFTAR